MSWQCEPCNQGSHGNCPDTDCECESCWDHNQGAKELARARERDDISPARKVFAAIVMGRGAKDWGQAMTGLSARRGDGLLITWLILSLLWDVAVIGGTAWLVFWRGHSGWWFLLAGLIACQPTLCKALQKRFGIEDEDDDG